MASVLYFDCFSGAAGDMILAALLDAGLPADELRAALGSLGVDHELKITKVLRSGVSATHVEVVEKHSHADQHGPQSREAGTGLLERPLSPAERAADHHHHHHHAHRTLADIGALIDRSGLSSAGKARAKRLFDRIGEAEAAIHDVPLDRVHLHEVGALDSIIDIVGAVFAMEWFGADEVMASPLNVGSGTVKIAHGTFPVPAPATLRLLGAAPVYSSGLASELVTPTGALLVTDYSTSYGPFPAMTVERTGYGAGSKDLTEWPNVLRVVIGQRAPTSREAPQRDGVVQIDCEIDDMNPQLFGPVSDRLTDAGALDVFLTPVQMKKGRPGTLLTVLAPSDNRQAICDLIFRETTTIGVRFHAVERETLERTWQSVDLAGGSIRMKVAGRNGEVLNAAPEFEDCVRVATATGQAVKHVQAAAMRAWLDRK